jgi:hypothetical protein
LEVRVSRFFFDLRFVAKSSADYADWSQFGKAKFAGFGEHRPLACSSRQLAEMPRALSANKLYVHVSGKLPETTGWQPVLPRTRTYARPM